MVYETEMNFTEALKQNNLGEMLEAEFGKWGHLTVEAVDLTIEVSKLEKISPELLIFTWAKESCFEMYPQPNTNKQISNPYAWDFGPLQINMGWCFKSIWVKEYKADGLHYDQVFGKVFYDGEKPSVFTGDPKSNLRMAARRLNARKGDDELKATLYPGPKSREDRHRGWVKYGNLFKHFFEIYTPESETA